MKDLLRGKPPEIPPVQRSTLWNPDGPRKICMPSDISGCTCARFAEYSEHISLDCCGLEMFNVCPKTVFGTPTEAVVALLHSGKGVLLGELRVAPVEHSASCVWS